MYLRMQLLIDRVNEFQDETIVTRLKQGDDRLKKMFEELAKGNKEFDSHLELIDSAHNKDEKQMLKVQKQRSDAREHNVKYELHAINLQDKVNELREKLDHGKHETFFNSFPEEDLHICDDDNVSLKDSDESNPAYLSETSVQQNLIRAQVEFYFSDYSLKRDKSFAKIDMY
ncbi:hypothetical protein RFI_20140 [Reticulomyxa filosa]|uniref:Uncharacterized protein n=1 Tax=Reticulomyxa filosa TaxID=46433 RepID=X6MVQ9_RETFI|nr:hypothetical protein RFI_20140 [Reticulomyxa filosa]|eukprot:ETO17190.1 hypothetical protein RFI_20140 [Reticulomyxa filosa]